MRIGVVKFNTTDYVEKAIRKLGHTPVIHQINEEALVETIQESPITHWIFTGTSLAVSVLNPISPQVPMDILQMKDKCFFLICYSMESLLYQLGYPVVERKEVKKGRFDLGPITVYRYHKFYIPANKVNKKVKVLQTYDGEVMTVTYKNTVLTQWHPERSNDGIQCLKNWIEG
jgi:imidazoleglycerol phosphate synthase glutamine amidotransferase subunit HisH